MDKRNVTNSVDKSTFVEYCLVNPVLAPLAAKYAFGYPYNDKNDEKVLLVFEIYKNVFNAMHELNQELYASLINIINKYKIFLDFSRNTDGKLSDDAKAFFEYCTHKVENYKSFLGSITEKEALYLESQYHRNSHDYADLSGNQHEDNL